MSATANETAILLFNKLKAFHDDKDFVLGVLCNAPNDEDMKTIINYMDNGDDVTIENLILLSLELGNNRDSQKD